MEQKRPMDVPLRAMRLQSLAIEAIAYDESAHLLTARFRDSGKTVIYEEVPPEIYDSLIFAESIGGYFHDHIEGHFPERRHH
jgi:hypothetical protein